MDTLTENIEARIRKQLRAMQMETTEYVQGILVERLLSGKGYMYIVMGKRLTLDQAVYYISTRKNS